MLRIGKVMDNVMISITNKIVILTEEIVVEEMLYFSIVSVATA